MFFLLAAAWCAPSGCALLDPAAEVRVVIPKPPLPWRRAFPDLVFSLRYSDGSGGVLWLHGVRGGSPVVVKCSKEPNSPVLAYPWSPEEPLGALKPAGGLWPWDLRNGESGTELVTSWETGAAAEVFRILWDAGADAALFNGERLAARMGAAPDPWAYEVRAIADAMAAGGFTAYDIDLLPSSDVLLAVPPGTWLLESPFRPPLAPEPAGTLLIEDLGFGLHHLFGPGGRMDVYLDERGAAVTRY